MKILSFDRDGYWIWSKRLEPGRFAELTGDGKRPLTRTGLLALLEGVEVYLKRRRKRYRKPAGGAAAG